MKDSFWSGFMKKAYLEKRPYKTMDIAKLDPMKSNEVWTAKIDGAHTVIDMKKGEIPKLYSHRISKRTSGPIEYNPKLTHIKKVSPVDAILRGETYAVDKNGRIVNNPEVITAVLNSGTQKSLELQKQLGIQTRTALIDVDRFNGEDVSHLPFEYKRQIMEQIVKKNQNFTLPDIAIKSKEKEKLLSSVIGNKHPQTKEGLIVHDLTSQNKPFFKAKVINDHDVYVRTIFPESSPTGRTPMAGGFEYSWEPNGPIKGRVGTGFDHAMKVDMLKNPQDYIGRVARVNALGMSGNEVLLKPSFVQWHVEKNIGRPMMAKQTIIVSKDIAGDRATAKDLARQFSDRMYTSRETGSSYRFRQIPPSKFDPKSYKTYSPKPGISIVYGKLKDSKN